ncbi:unnamed protein product, partial [Iphiclides podalirius]
MIRATVGSSANDSGGGRLVANDSRDGRFVGDWSVRRAVARMTERRRGAHYGRGEARISPGPVGNPAGGRFTVLSRVRDGIVGERRTKSPISTARAITLLYVVVKAPNNIAEL